MVAINPRIISVYWDWNKYYGHALDLTSRQLAIVSALNNLPKPLRQLIILFVFERRSRQEIAEIFSWPLERVRIALSLCGSILEKKCHHFQPDIPENMALATRFGSQFTIYGELVALKYKLTSQIKLR